MLQEEACTEHPCPAGMKVYRAVVILEDAGNLFTPHACMPYDLFPRQWSHRFQETWERMFFEHCFWWLPEYGYPWERVEKNVINYSGPLFLSWPWMLKNLRTLGIHYLCVCVGGILFAQTMWFHWNILFWSLKCRWSSRPHCVCEGSFSPDRMEDRDRMEKILCPLLVWTSA